MDIPLQAYLATDTENMGQFERTLIIVGEGASVHYVEGCTAPCHRAVARAHPHYHDQHRRRHDTN